VAEFHPDNPQIVHGNQTGLVEVEQQGNVTALRQYRRRHGQEPAYQR
jgi:hypothetical protein